MWDSTVPVYGLAMRLERLENLPDCELPEGYGWRFYEPGDERDWVRMWTAAGGFAAERDAMETFERDFPDRSVLRGRMLFLTCDGAPVATATAWFGDRPGEGKLHWVCVDPAHQGKGLSKPLIAKALERCRELGDDSASLLTQTPCWVAIRMYHRFGFRPEVRSEEDVKGWRIVGERTGMSLIEA